jgi:hypothetical protein
VSDPAEFPDWLHSACDQYEAQCRVSSGPADFGSALLPASDSIEKRLRLFEELSRIDMEWRWRRGWSRPRSADYWSFWGDDLPGDVRRRLAQAELMVRATWGDRPSVEEIARGLPDQRDETRQLLSRALDETWPVLVVVRLSGSLAWEGHLDSPLEVGRRRSDEPELTSCVGGRLAVAGGSLRRVSRCQWVISRYRRDEVMLDTTQATNNSQINGKSLEPGQRLVVGFPVRLQLDPLLLELTPDW